MLIDHYTDDYDFFEIALEAVPLPANYLSAQ